MRIIEIEFAGLRIFHPRIRKVFKLLQESERVGGRERGTRSEGGSGRKWMGIGES